MDQTQYSPVKQEFLDYLLDNLHSFLPDYVHEDTSIQVKDIVKSNDVVLTAVILNEPGVMTSPTIYVDSYIDAYENGKDFDSILSEIADTYVENRNKEFGNFDLHSITDFESVKDLLVTKIVNTGMNQEYLKNIPHEEVGDLSVFCQIRLPEEVGAHAMVTVHEGLLKGWDVSFEEVYAAAKQNDLILTEPKLIPMEEVVLHLLDGKDFAQEGFLPEKKMQSDPMYVFSSADQCNGAKFMNRPELLEQIAEFLETDFVVLPSSIHETIVVPLDDGLLNLEELGKMVREINETEVRPEEVLSDHIYVYAREEKELSFEKDGEKQMMLVTKKEKDAEKEPLKKGIKDKLKESTQKVKEQALKQKDVPMAAKQAAIE